MYIPLSRKYRPKTFDEVIGQSSISKTLINAIKSSHISHAYLFSGPRGTGKTTIARILAKAINCENENIKPCYKCKTCLNNSNQDIIEIDGASNRGIDEIRNIKDNVKFAPLSSKYKIYIIDEVHMLTEQAFNALLKTLEEPPSFIVFMFATTEVHKVPETILSRCQKFNVKLIPLDVIEKRLAFILESENISYDKESLKIIAKISGGSMRDALSLLDQVIAYSPNDINIKNTNFILGIINSEIIFETVNDILSKNIKSLLEKISIVEENGFSLVQFLSQIRNHFRNLMLIKSEIALDSNEEIYNLQKEKMTLQKIIKNIDIINQTMYEIKTQDSPKTSLELCLIKLTIDDNENVSKDVSKLETFKNYKNPNEILLDEKNKKVDTPKEKIIFKENIKNTSLNSNLETNFETEMFEELEKFEHPEDLNKNNSEVKIDENKDLNSNFIDNPNLQNLLNKNWDLFLTKISNEKIFLAEYLKNNTGIEINNKNIKFSFDIKFYADGLNRNKEIIAKVLKDLFKTDFNVSIDFSPYKNKKNEKIENSKVKIENFNKDSEKQKDSSIAQKEIIDEKIQKVLDIIGGEFLP